MIEKFVKLCNNLRRNIAKEYYMRRFFNDRKVIFNKNMKYILQLVSLAVVILLLVTHTLVIGTKGTVPDITKIENVDINRSISNLMLIYKEVFDISQIVASIYIFITFALSSIIIPLFIYLFFKTINSFISNRKHRHLRIKSTSSENYEVVYITQSKFLC